MAATDTSLQPSQPDLPHQAMEQAAEWFALLRSGEATAADCAQWQVWLNSSADNEQAWHYVECISERFKPIQNSPKRRNAANVFRAVNSRPGRRRQIVLGIATLMGTSLLSWVTWRHSPLPGIALAWTADYRTGTGEIREITLSDGTRVWLNAASAFNEDYRNNQRRLHLVAGEILIQTAADAFRPFVVNTPQGQLRALGTRFTIRLDQTETFVAVYEGAIEVRTAATGTTAILPAGRQARFTNTSLADSGTADPAREAWTRGILIAQNIPLAEVVQELRRYHNGHLGIAPEVANLPVFGSYPANDPDRALAMLESVMPIRVRRTLPWWVSIEPRNQTANANP